MVTFPWPSPLARFTSPSQGKRVSFEDLNFRIHLSSAGSCTFFLSKTDKADHRMRVVCMRTWREVAWTALQLSECPGVGFYNLSFSCPISTHSREGLALYSQWWRWCSSEYPQRSPSPFKDTISQAHKWDLQVLRLDVWLSELTVLKRVIWSKFTKKFRLLLDALLRNVCVRVHSLSKKIPKQSYCTFLSHAALRPTVYFGWSHLQQLLLLLVLMPKWESISSEKESFFY